MGVPRDLVRDNKGLGEWCILSGYRGSIAHGMYIPSSDPLSIDDKDAMAVCVPSPDYYLGLKSYFSRGTREIKRNEWDIVIYEAKKYIRLLAKGNPNVLALLWLQENNYLKITEAGNLLLENRNLFVGRHVYHSFVGYATGQLHRMTRGSKKGYMGAKRKALVDKFGYDPKNAAHLVRLLNMGIEFLKDGVMYVHRKDARRLLEIKRGEWSLERIKAEADRLFALAEQAYVGSELPRAPDRKDVSMLCETVIRHAWAERDEGRRRRGQWKVAPKPTEDSDDDSD